MKINSGTIFENLIETKETKNQSYKNERKETNTSISWETPEKENEQKEEENVSEKTLEKKESNQMESLILAQDERWRHA